MVNHDMLKINFLSTAPFHRFFWIKHDGFRSRYLLSQWVADPIHVIKKYEN